MATATTKQRTEKSEVRKTESPASRDLALERLERAADHVSDVTAFKVWQGEAGRRLLAPAIQQRAMEALRLAVGAWDDVDEPLGPPVVHVLEALQACVQQGNMDALTRKGGPVEWARRHLGFPKSRAEAARQFVERIESRLQGFEEPHGRPLRSPETAAMFSDDAAAWLCTLGPFVGLNGFPTSGARDRMIEEVQQVAGRTKPDAKAFGVALLVGWGMDRDDARNRLKPSDL